MTVITNMHKLRLKNNNKQNKLVNGSNAEAKAKEQLFTVLPLRGQFLYYLICFFVSFVSILLFIVIIHYK